MVPSKKQAPELLRQQPQPASSAGYVHECSHAGCAGSDQLVPAKLCWLHIPRFPVVVFQLGVGRAELFMEELWVLKRCCANPNSSRVWHLSWKQCGLWENAKKFTQASSNRNKKTKKKAEFCQVCDSSASSTQKQVLSVSALCSPCTYHTSCAFMQKSLPFPQSRDTVRVSDSA